MDWFKVKVSHVLYSDMSPKIKCAWLDLMALTSQIECMPTETQMNRVCSPNIRQTLSELLSNDGRTLPEVLLKVLEDVEKAKDERDRLKAYRREKKEERTSTKTSTVHVRQNRQTEEKEYNTPLTPQPPIVDNSKAIKPDHVKFLESWSKLYESISGHPYKIDWAKDSKIVTTLIKTFSYDLVVEKSKILFDSCQNKNLWFTKDGISDFTINKLSSQWNGIIKKGSNSDDWVKQKEEEIRNA